jgi:hypothetical protein
VFTLHQAEPIAPTAIPDARLRHLHDHWQAVRGARAMPALRDIDWLTISDNAGRRHVLAVEAPRAFRYLVYGSLVTNPDRVEMKGRTTMDYPDQGFAGLVTDHLAAAVAAGAPRCFRIDAAVDGKPYRYIRLALPLGDAAGQIAHLLVGTQRIDVDPAMDRFRVKT